MSSFSLSITPHSFHTHEFHLEANRTHLAPGGGGGHDETRAEDGKVKSS